MHSMKSLVLETRVCVHIYIHTRIDFEYNTALWQTVNLRPIHTACRAHAAPMPCRAAKGLECVFPIWFTQCGRVWFTLGMPRPCRSSQGHGTARPRLASSGYHAHFHEVYQKHSNLRCRWPVWNQATFVMNEEKLIILVQGHECLYNLQHKITTTISKG